MPNTNHPERSQEIVPQASIQTMSGSMPGITQDLERCGELRQRNPLMANHNSTQQIRTKPYNRDRSNRTRRRRTDNVDPSTYQIPIMGSESMLISLFSTISSTTSLQEVRRYVVKRISQRHHHQHGRLLNLHHQHMHRLHTRRLEEIQMRNKNVRKVSLIVWKSLINLLLFFAEPVEEEDFDTISLGSSTD
jgi:hypothetical protein